MKIESFGFPAPIEDDDDGMVALIAEGRSKKKKEKNAGVVSVTIGEDGKLGQMSAVLRGGDLADSPPYTLSSTAIVEGKITVIFVGHCREAQPPLKGECDRYDCPWEIRMISGDFKYEPLKGAGNKYFQWQGDAQGARDIFGKTFSAYLKCLLRNLLEMGGAGIQMYNNRHAVPVEALKENGSIVSL